MRLGAMGATHNTRPFLACASFFFFLATNKHDFKATTTETTQILCTQDKNKHKKKALNLENNTQNQNPLTELL